MRSLRITTFENGYLLSKNARFITWVFLFILVLTVIGIIFSPIALFFLFAKKKTIVDSNKKEINQSIVLFSFELNNKKITLNDYKYISVIPTKETQTFQSRSGMVSTNTDYFSSVKVYKKRLRAGIEITKYSTKFEAEQIAQELGKQLELNYFTYSPMIIREKMLEE